MELEGPKAYYYSIGAITSVAAELANSCNHNYTGWFRLFPAAEFRIDQLPLWHFAVGYVHVALS